MFKGLISSLILKGKIETTVAKAKAIRGQIDKFVTRAKKGTLAARRQLLGSLDQPVVEKLMNEVAPGLTRLSGFTQMVKIGLRKGDSAPMVLLRWSGLEAVEKKKPDSKKTPVKTVKTTGKKSRAKKEKDSPK